MFKINKKYPKFICLGVQKSATTWLYSQFCKHPQFKMPKTKELRFFDPFTSEYSFEDYLSFFDTNKICGDMTPEYFTSKTNPKLFKELFPNTKLFVILRDPTERAFSHYRMMKDYNNVKTNFIDAFNQNFRSISSKGFYEIQLKNYLEYFELDKNLKIFFYDDLLKDSIKFFSSICEYLEADVFYDETINIRLKSKYHGDGLSISKEDKLYLNKYYLNSVNDLSKLINKELNWLKD